MTACPSLMHVVYYVSDLTMSPAFYADLFELEVVDQLGDGSTFLKFPGSRNYFDIGLVESDNEARQPDPPPRRGVYHVGWVVSDIDEFATLRRRLQERDVLVGEADHTTHLSIYAQDPDGNEVEVCWARPAPAPNSMTVSPLDLEEALASFRREEEQP